MSEDGKVGEDEGAGDDFRTTNTFRYEERRVDALTDVYALLAELADDPHASLVMGRPKIDSGERSTAYFVENPTPFWFIDLDGVPLLGDTPATITRYLPFLHGKTYVYAFSQKAGIANGLRCRV